MGCEDLSPALINQIAYDIIHGKADPADARRLLECYCDSYDKGKPIPHDLAMHLRDSLRGFLDGKKTLSSALGITGKRGRPSPDNTGMALAVLQLRFKGESHQDALGLVAEDFECADSTVGEAWRKHKLDAWIEFRLERNLEESPWSDDEVSRLVEIIESNQPSIAPK